MANGKVVKVELQPAQFEFILNALATHIAMLQRAANKDQVDPELFAVRNKRIGEYRTLMSWLSTLELV